MMVQSIGKIISPLGVAVAVQQAHGQILGIKH